MSYARQYSMVRLSDGSSILPGSTKLLWASMTGTMGLTAPSRAILRGRPGFDGDTNGRGLVPTMSTSIKVHQTKKRQVYLG